MRACVKRKFMKLISLHGLFKLHLCVLLYRILRCQIQPPDKNLAPVEVRTILTAGLWPAAFFFGGFSAAVNFSAAAAQFGGWGPRWGQGAQPPPAPNLA